MAAISSVSSARARLDVTRLGRTPQPHEQSDSNVDDLITATHGTPMSVVSVLGTSRLTQRMSSAAMRVSARCRSSAEVTCNRADRTPQNSVSHEGTRSWDHRSWSEAHNRIDHSVQFVRAESGKQGQAHEAIADEIRHRKCGGLSSGPIIELCNGT